MKTKKVLALLLALCMVFSLAACSSSSSTEDTETADTTTEETADAEEAEADSDITYETVTLTATTSYNENESGGTQFQYFADYLSDLTDGAITVDITFGGTVASASEELTFLSDGSVDIACIQTPVYSDLLPLMQFSSWCLEGISEALDFYNYVGFDNEASAELIQQEAADNNVIYLAFTAGGPNVWLSTQSLESIDDLVGLKFGTSGSTTVYEQLGLSAVSCQVSDTYESLSRGVIDAVVMAFTPTVSMKWYEAATNYLFVGTYACGNPFTVNLDTWNSLSEDAQNALIEAAEATSAYSIELQEELLEEYLTTVEEAGCTVNYMAEEETATLYATYYEVNSESCMDRAADLGIEDNMQVVLDAVADYYADYLD